MPRYYTQHQEPHNFQKFSNVFFVEPLYGKSTRTLISENFWRVAASGTAQSSKRGRADEVRRHAHKKTQTFTHAHTHTHMNSLSHTHSLSLTHTHTRTHTNAHACAHIHTHAHKAPWVPLQYQVSTNNLLPLVFFTTSSSSLTQVSEASATSATSTSKRPRRGSN